MKGLEALEDICNKGCDFCDLYCYEHNKKCKEEMKGCANCVFCGGQHDIVEKELKALKIIINKSVDVHLLKSYKNISDYNAFRTRYNTVLTEEEFNLIKEISQNE